MKAVLWDMDGTLLDSEPTALRALAAALADNGIGPIADLDAHVLGRAADAIHRWLAQVHGLSEDPLAWESRKHRHHLANLSELKPFPDALRIFQTLASQGVPQAVVSNSDRLIMDAQLRHIGLARPGQVTVSRNDVRQGKPDPEGYLRAAWLLRCEPQDCLVIEDSSSGIAAGKAAGMTTCAVPGASTNVRPDISLTSLEEVLNLQASR